MTWGEVLGRFSAFPDGRIWGIPRGGKVVEGLLVTTLDNSCARWVPASSPDHADFFVDDIIDSGATAHAWETRYGKHVYALVNKQSSKADAALDWVVFPWEVGSEDHGPERAVTRLLEFIGEDPKREGLVDTPMRVVKALAEMTSGYTQDPAEIMARTFDEPYDEMVVLKGIRFTSLCEHHMLPFSGEAAVAYLPAGRVAGVSKLARIVQCFAKRLQVQERMTQQIAQAIETHLRPAGVGVVVRAHHACMGCRGVLQPETEMVTSCMLGRMRETPAARQELLDLLG